MTGGGHNDIHDVNNSKSKPETHAAPNCSQKLLWAEFWEIVGCYSHLEKRQCMYFLCFGSCWNLDLTGAWKISSNLMRKPNGNLRLIWVPSSHIFGIVISRRRHHLIFVQLRSRLVLINSLEKWCNRHHIVFVRLCVTIIIMHHTWMAGHFEVSY